MNFLISVLLREIKGNNSAHRWGVLVQENSLPFLKLKVPLAAAVIVEGNCPHRRMLSQRLCSSKDQLWIDSRVAGI